MLGDTHDFSGNTQQTNIGVPFLFYEVSSIHIHINIYLNKIQVYYIVVFHNNN